MQHHIPIQILQLHDNLCFRLHVRVLQCFPLFSLHQSLQVMEVMKPQQQHQNNQPQRRTGTPLQSVASRPTGLALASQASRLPEFASALSESHLPGVPLVIPGLTGFEPSPSPADLVLEDRRCQQTLRRSCRAAPTMQWQALWSSPGMGLHLGLPMEGACTGCSILSPSQTRSTQLAS